MFYSDTNLVKVSLRTLPEGYAETAGDCDDYNAGIYIGAIDIAYDGIDQDCNGEDASRKVNVGTSHWCI